MEEVDDSNSGMVTTQMLKSASGEFDVESIHTLNLQKQGNAGKHWGKVIFLPM